MSKRNRSRNFTKNLPPEILEQLNKMIVDGCTYEEIGVWLKKFDVNVHRSTINRYGQGYLDRLERIKIISEQTKAVFEDNKGKPATELSDASVLIVTQMLMESLMENEEIDMKDLTKAAQALATLQRSNVSSEKLKIDTQTKVQMGLDMFVKRISTELNSKYPELQERLTEIAQEVAESIEGQN